MIECSFAFLPYIENSIHMHAIEIEEININSIFHSIGIEFWLSCLHWLKLCVLLLFAVCQQCILLILMCVQSEKRFTIFISIKYRGSESESESCVLEWMRHFGWVEIVNFPLALCTRGDFIFMTSNKNQHIQNSTQIEILKICSNCCDILMLCFYLNAVVCFIFFQNNPDILSRCLGYVCVWLERRICQTVHEWRNTYSVKNKQNTAIRAKGQFF